jgi:uncharacterized cupredoxin-like copper-binding protein
VKFIAREFSFHPSEAAVNAGEVTFEVTNEGAIEHTFVLQDHANRILAEIASIVPSKTEVTRTRVDGGTYVIFCRVPGHKEAGMTATLRVGP